APHRIRRPGREAACHPGDGVSEPITLDADLHGAHPFDGRAAVARKTTTPCPVSPLLRSGTPDLASSGSANLQRVDMTTHRHGDRPLPERTGCVGLHGRACAVGTSYRPGRLEAPSSPARLVPSFSFVLLREIFCPAVVVSVVSCVDTARSRRSAGAAACGAQGAATGGRFRAGCEWIRPSSTRPQLSPRLSPVVGRVVPKTYTRAS